MKHILTLTIILLLSSVVWGQESFKKKYIIEPTMIYNDSLIRIDTIKKKFRLFRKTKTKKIYTNDTIYLTRDIKVKFELLEATQQQSIQNRYNAGSSVTVSYQEALNGKNAVVTTSLIIDTTFYNSISKKADTTGIRKITKGFVKFDNDKLIVNPYLQYEINRDDLYYYKLKNRRSMSLLFKELTVSAITIPVKYRIGIGNIPEDFSSGFNLALFGGYSWGKERFLHIAEVGNKTYVRKHTIGGFYGGSVVTLNQSNTSNANEPLGESVTINKGLLSVGLGYTYAYNKFNVGIFYGHDFAIGKDAKKWNHNTLPWIGIAFGYGLFSVSAN